MSEKKQALKVILVNPHLRTIEEGYIENSLKGLQKSIGDHHIEMVWIDDDNIMYVDDEGLFREDQSFFVMKGTNKTIPIAGRGVILGNDMVNGDTKPVNMSLEDAVNMIDFHTREEMADLANHGVFA